MLENTTRPSLKFVKITCYFFYHRNIEEAVKFSGLPQHRQLTYANKQLIAREVITGVVLLVPIFVVRCHYAVILQSLTRTY